MQGIKRKIRQTAGEKIPKQFWQVTVKKLDRHKEKSSATSGAETNISESMKKFRIQPDPDPDSQH